MKIESVIRRKAGSSQTIGGITYHWNDKNGHVCEVEDPEHAKILLSHPEGWRAVGADIKPKEGQGGEESKPEPKATRKTAAKTNKEGQGGEESKPEPKATRKTAAKTNKEGQGGE